MRDGSKTCRDKRSHISNRLLCRLGFATFFIYLTSHKTACHQAEKYCKPILEANGPEMSRSPSKHKLKIICNVARLKGQRKKTSSSLILQEKIVKTVT